MLAESDGWPIAVHDVLARAYPNTRRFTWHYRSLWRARNKFTVMLARGWLGPTPELMKQIRGE
jgi:hypothetical protein